MSTYFLIAHHGAQGYSLQLVGYAELLATIEEPRLTANSLGTFPSEAACAAYLRETVGISAERISASLGALAAGVMEPHMSLPLSRVEAQRVLEQGYPT
jgi:hypothetical protein